MEDILWEGFCRAKDKLLYGMTNVGGINGKGIIFSFNPKDSAIVKLHDFVDSTGSKPLGKLIEAKDGMLYGLTSSGGSTTGGNGTIFLF